MRPEHLGSHSHASHWPLKSQRARTACCCSPTALKTDFLQHPSGPSNPTPQPLPLKIRQLSALLWCLVAGLAVTCSLPLALRYGLKLYIKATRGRKKANTLQTQLLKLRRCCSVWAWLSLKLLRKYNSSPTSFLAHASMPELVRLFVFPKNKISVFCDLEKLEAFPLSGLTPAGVSLLPTQGLHRCPLTAHALLALGSDKLPPGEDECCLLLCLKSLLLACSEAFSDLRTHLCFSYIPVVLTIKWLLPYDIIDLFME